MARLKNLKPKVRAADVAVAAVPAKAADPYYRSPDWLALRERALRRDGYRCTAPGCSARAVVVDHVVDRRQGGGDALGNLRSLCRAHDNRVKEGPDGARRSGGALEGRGGEISATAPSPRPAPASCGGFFSDG